MAFILIGALIFIVGGLAYTLDINVIAALGILIGLAIVCGIIGYRLSLYINKEPSKVQEKASRIKMLTIPSVVIGAILSIIGFATVSESSRVVATSQKHLLFETVVTPSGLTLLGVFAIMLGITFWIVTLSQNPDEDK